MEKQKENTDVGDNTVEDASGVAEAMLSGGQLTEVARSFWDDVVVKLEDNSASRFGVYCDVKLKQMSAFVATASNVARRTKTRDLFNGARSLLSASRGSVHL